MEKDMNNCIEASVIRSSAQKDLGVNGSAIRLNGRYVNKGQCRAALMGAYLSMLGVKARNFNAICNEFQSHRNQNVTTLSLVRGESAGNLMLEMACHDAVGDGGKALVLIDVTPVTSFISNTFRGD